MHEALTDHLSVKGSSDRAFGITIGTILFIIGAWQMFSDLNWLAIGLLLVGSALILLGLFAPHMLAPANRLWLRFGLLLFRVGSPVMMLMVYAVGVLPVGLLMRALGKDPLRLRLDPHATSYWITRHPPGPRPDSMANQY